MSEWIGLREVLQKQHIHGGFINKTVDYIPDIKRQTLKRQETGWKFEQTLETEIGLVYHLAYYEGKAYLIADRMTTKGITFFGNVGAKNVSEVLKKCASIYNNEKLGAVGIPWEENNIGILKTLPKVFFEPCEGFWTAITHSGQDYAYTQYGSYQIVIYWHDGTQLREAVVQHYIPVAKMFSNTRSTKGIRVLVELSEDTLVDLESVKSAKLQIATPDMIK